jgi:hypothetical protein
MSEARIDRLKRRFDAIDDRLQRIELIVTRMHERLAATLPYLATKADVARVEARVIVIEATLPTPSLITRPGVSLSGRRRRLLSRPRSPAVP